MRKFISTALIFSLLLSSVITSTYALPEDSFSVGTLESDALKVVIHEYLMVSIKNMIKELNEGNLSNARKIEIIDELICSLIHCIDRDTLINQINDVHIRNIIREGMVPRTARL